jgi:hypothetical protein
MRQPPMLCCKIVSFSRRHHALVLAICFIALFPSFRAHAQQRSTPINDVASWSDLLRRQVGQTLFDAMKAILDSSPLILHLLAGHFALSTTQRYIEADRMAQRRVVELV